ncbi:hypothetical protein EW145_g1586 [Phellinidium pouzarii]|uniref:Fork-head domain-containing protein n=1 Tax=Phellinidium pouzarii TaxID=167371 RepID=A0A4S4LFS9_9AGAM|nr:hypothetical protein EW145_g1586 [Phellinidium pouzarii]
MTQQPQTMQPSALQIAHSQELTATELAVANSSYYPDPPNDLTGGLPINLDSLRDGPPGTKPFYPYSTLIRYAIKGSPNQKLLLEDIYYAIESRFPYFRTAPSGWKNSVRHNLSLNPCFEKVARPLTDRGKGSYWTVNDNVDPRTGVHRVRKKRSHKSKGSPHHRLSDEPEMDYVPDEAAVPSGSAGFESAGFEQPPAPPAVMHADPVAQSQYVYTPVLPASAPEVDENGNVNWRTAWLNELAKLQHITGEQDKLQAEPEWYREMLFRVRTAMMAPIDVNGVLQIAATAAQSAGVASTDGHEQGSQ